MATQAVAPDIIPASSGAGAGVGKKKRKTKPAAETHDVPAQTTTQPGATDAPRSEVPKATEGGISSSPLLDLVHKRLRNVTKKIQRIREYNTKPPESLNPDQRKTVQTLPHLEAVKEELDEFKKALEPLEAQAERAHALALEQVAQAAEERRQATVLSIRAAFIPVLAAIIALSHVDPASLHHSDITESEIASLTSLVALLTDPHAEKQDVLNGLVSGEGSYQGTDYTRLLHLATISPPTEELTEPAVDVEPEVTTPVPDADQVDVSQPTSTSVTESGLGGSFHFMQASELDEGNSQPQVNGIHEETADPVIDVIPDAVHVPHDTSDPLPPPAPETRTELDATVSDNLDWAADDASELPPINSLHAKFGTSPAGSGTVTPTAPAEPAPKEETPSTEADGFTAVKRGGPRGAGAGDGFHHRGAPPPHQQGERGRGRDGGRGGGRGWRGDGEFRGRGGGRGFRGGDGFRGGERGGYRGSGRGRPAAAAATEQTAS